MSLHRRPIFSGNRSALTILYHVSRLAPNVKGVRSARGQSCDILISERYRWIYIGVPLTATRSMIGSMTRAGIYDMKRMKINPRFFFENATLRREYTTFSFVRNPWSRVVSCYNKKILNCDDLGKMYFLSRYSGLRPMMAFDDFVRWLGSTEGRDEIADPHWLSQWRLLHGADGVPLYDHLGRLEQFDEDKRLIFSVIRTPEPEVPKARRSQDMFIKPMHDDFHDYYDSATRDIVAERYEKDIEAFGYSFE